MTSDEGARADPLDERLAELRDSVLLSGESITAQEMGDHGQAVIVTNARVIVLKAGLAATGELEGRRVAAYEIAEIKAVKVHKGPMGAAIEICTDRQEAPALSGPPDHVTVFTGQQRAKRCAAIGSKIQSALGKSGTKAEPEAAQPPVEVPDPEPTAVEPPESEPTGEMLQPDLLPTMEPVGQESEMPAEASAGFRPNPNLPKPVADWSRAARTLMVLGTMTAILLVGLAVMAPLRSPQDTALPDTAIPRPAQSPEVLREEYAAICDYRARVRPILKQANSATARLEAALRSGNRAEIDSALKGNRVDEYWRTVVAVKAPAGLAGAKQDLSSGLFALRAAASGSVSSEAGSMSTALQRIAEARALMQKGLQTIEAMQAQISGELSGLKSLK